MLKIKYHTQFKKDLKSAKKSGLDMGELKVVVETLQKEEPLDEKYRDHPLKDSKHYMDCRECHIRPDWLLLYRINKNELILSLIRTGSHSKLY